MLKDDVLEYLEQNKGRIVTGGMLARDFGVSRTAVWKSVHNLIDEGHTIESIKNSGYRLSGESDGLVKSIIEEKLITDAIGRTLEIHDTLGSTNTYIKSLDTDQLPHGFTVVADAQTDGRGRYLRKFSSPAREGVYVSLFLKPKPSIDPGNMPILTICAAVAVIRALKNACRINASVKWVNDIFVDGKKLCGILSEAMLSTEANTVDYAVIGIGVNTGRVANDVRDVATSIQEINGMRGVRNPLISEILNAYEDVYLDYIECGGQQKIIDEYSSHLTTIGKVVEGTQRGKTIRGTVLGIDTKGSLIVRENNKKIQTVRSGEIKELKLNEKN